MKRSDKPHGVKKWKSHIGYKNEKCMVKYLINRVKFLQQHASQNVTYMIQDMYCKM